MYLKEIFPEIVQYRLARANLLDVKNPINLTFSVTNICQSRCKTCNIWQIYRDDPAKRDEELTLAEIEKIFSSMGHVYIFNVSGGEPFLRPDFVGIIEAACTYLSPGIIHIPTNAIAEKQIRNKTRKIVGLLKSKYPSTKLTIKPSLDHIDKRHDTIRGVPGNFEKVISVFEWLKSVRPEYPNLSAELGTVISRWNIDDVEEIAAFITRLGPDSYRNEIAEQRSEMLNIDDPITPGPEDYKKAVDYFIDLIKKNMKSKNVFLGITNAFRLEYYQLAARTLAEKRQVIPCYAGISNAHMTPYGGHLGVLHLGLRHAHGKSARFRLRFSKTLEKPPGEGNPRIHQGGQLPLPPGEPDVFQYFAPRTFSPEGPQKHRRPVTRGSRRFRKELP